MHGSQNTTLSQHHKLWNLNIYIFTHLLPIVLSCNAKKQDYMSPIQPDMFCTDQQSVLLLCNIFRPVQTNSRSSPLHNLTLILSGYLYYWTICLYNPNYQNLCWFIKINIYILTTRGTPLSHLTTKTTNICVFYSWEKNHKHSFPRRKQLHVENKTRSYQSGTYCVAIHLLLLLRQSNSSCLAKALGMRHYIYGLSPWQSRIFF